MAGPGNTRVSTVTEEAGIEAEQELRERFARDVAAARHGDRRAGGRARAMASIRAGYDPEWDAALAEARDVVGETPPDPPSYEDAATRGRLRPTGGALPLVGLALAGAALVLAMAAIWG